MDGTTIDLMPIFQIIIGLLATVATPLCALAVRWVMKRIGIEDEALSRSVMKRTDQLLDRAADYGIAKLRDSNIAEVRTKNQLLGVAASYAASAAPALIGRLGIDPGSIEGQRSLMNMIEARLPGKNEWIAVDVDGDGIPDNMQFAQRNE